KVEAKAKDNFTREGQREERFRNRGINLSYREKLSSAEVIKKGEPIDSVWNGEGIPPVSLEYRYARRVGAEIGDELTFDILGVEQKGVVKNLRKVRWTSFLPNFFIQFPKGVIDEAPKTYLMAIGGEFESNLISKIGDGFSNVSIVDLKRVISKVTDVMKQMSIALISMSILVLLVGLFVLTSLLAHHLNGRINDLFLFRLIGVEKKNVKMMVRSEFFTLSFFSSLFGSFLGVNCAGFFGVKFFQTEFIVDINLFLLTTLGVTFVSYLLTLFLVSRFFKKNENLVSAF
ncbi:MAG: hypothetical protein CME61_04920, partial [Halobacteriovoraceae bacterium]|nr:hypothetical protein [Halobacteriovoraceae bacterium]